jgi:uncharacterized membrane protein YhhN
MQKSLSTVLIGIYLFLLIPLNIVGHYLGMEVLVQISKPLLLPLLIGVFVITVKSKDSKIFWPFISALFFSWVGDVALMFDTQLPIMFMVGLGGFMVAHVHYVFVFLKSRNTKKSINKSTWLIIPLYVVYTVTLLSFLWPQLGALRIPVLVYALVLMLMGISALIRKPTIGYSYIVLGTILFIISDSSLAINKFHGAFSFAREITMVTYTLAQLLIVLGMSKYLNSKQ